MTPARLYETAMFVGIAASIASATIGWPDWPFWAAFAVCGAAAVWDVARRRRCSILCPHAHDWRGRHVCHCDDVLS